MTPADLDIALTLPVDGHRPGDDPAVVQVWASYCEATAEAEIAAGIATDTLVREALTWPLVCAQRVAFGLANPPEVFLAKR